MGFLAFLAGYVLGSVPTAGLLGRLKGIDLRQEGSGNPGTNNALRTGGPALALTVLLVEATKGFLAVWLGGAMSDDVGVVAAGIGAVAGNVYNVWYRFEGGKGLGISLGVLAGLWPTVLPVVIGVIVIVVLLTRSAGIASLAAIAALLASSLVWVGLDAPTGGVAPNVQVVVLAIAMALLMSWKHWRDSPLNPDWTKGSPGRSSRGPR